MIHGSIVALITPFKDGKLDEAALRNIVKWHIEQGTNGIVPVGTTGECPTLTPEEHCRVIEITAEIGAEFLYSATRRLLISVSAQL